ncbi:unnamed protein product, partial [marine sediment metagenome]
GMVNLEAIRCSHNMRRQMNIACGVENGVGMS